MAAPTPSVRPTSPSNAPPSLAAPPAPPHASSRISSTSCPPSLVPPTYPSAPASPTASPRKSSGPSRNSVARLKAGKSYQFEELLVFSSQLSENLGVGASYSPFL